MSIYPGFDDFSILHAKKNYDTKEKRATMLRLVEAWKKSGLMQTEFAVRNNIPPSKFKYQIGKSNQSTHDDFSSDFIQIPVSPVNFGSQEKEIRLYYPNGTWMTLPIDTPVAVLITFILLFFFIRQNDGNFRPSAK